MADTTTMPSQGEPKGPSAGALLGARGGESFTTGDFDNLNRGSGSFDGASRESGEALAEVGGLRKVTKHSSITSHGPVEIPREGAGPGARAETL